MRAPWREWRRQRDHALVRAVQAESRMVAAEKRRDEAVAEAEALKRAVERMTDNALFGAGHAPIFDPEAPRFRPRPLAAQQAEADRAAKTLSPAEWRRKVEALDREAAARDQRGRLTEDLKKMAEERIHGENSGV